MEENKTPTRWQRFKSFAAENAEPIVAGAGILSVTGLYVWAVIATSKEQAKAIEEYNTWAGEMNDWLNDERESGNGVYQLHDGRYLVVPLDAPQETVIK